ADDHLPWTQLSLSTCAIDEYLRAHPKHDGRGVVIAVLDTGVDMGIPGLDRLPNGEVKVVDVQDFSGEGDVELPPAIFNESRDRIIHYADDGSPQTFVPPPPGSLPDGAKLWFGLLEEKAFQNGSVPDVNDNGDRDDEFAICVVTTEEGGHDDALVFIDTDLDRDWSDEKPLRNYRVAQETFTFARTRKEAQLPQLTCAINVFPRKRLVVVHFDDGGHGTHVAGIAAGYRINGQDRFNGVAPGAKIMSLKIGDNRLSGGATTTGAKKRAFEYAARYAREHGVPVVCNLSYGINSELEGYSDIDKFLETLCRKNPNLIVCSSAGNNGPGISSIGTPAAADSVISSAALLAADTARDVMGAHIEHAVVTEFSSRGGELNKPDLATPGYAASTVPLWNRRGDFFRGTSMASPYTAGMAALLISEARSQGHRTVRSSWIKSALARSASPVPGFNALDFGPGCPNMPKAAAALRDIIGRASTGPLFRYEVTTESPFAVKGEGPTAYWRTTCFPIDRPQIFTIKPVFEPTVDAAARRSFARRCILRSTADWCRLEQTQIYFRAEQSATVRVSYNADMLREPGLYVGQIEMLDGDTVVERLVNTVVVPHRFNEANGYKQKFADQKVQGWQPKRYFIQAPTGATAMHLELSAADDHRSTAFIRTLFRPNGTGIRVRALRLNSDDGRLKADYDLTDQLEPGIWELCVTSRRPDEHSTYDLTVRFDGLAATPAKVTSWSHTPGATPNGKLSLTNLFDNPLAADLSGKLEGYRKTFSQEITPDEDAATMTIKFEPDVTAVRVRCDMTEEVFAMFTDVAINLFDPSGKSLMTEGMGDRHFTGRVRSPGGSKSCKLEFKAAFTYPDSDQTAEFEVIVDYLYKDPIPIELKRGDDADCTFYPGVKTPLTFKLRSTPPESPKGTHHAGYLRATNRADGHVAVEIPIETKD
ncbi:MAG: S8 family serine peptidase, partial [Planctomycetota bacterium]|nr:S8 family serine peptidase [Planctomycetota bacterium]